MAEYTEAQHKAINKYRSGKVHIDLLVAPEVKNRIKAQADAEGLSVQKYILKRLGETEE